MIWWIIPIVIGWLSLGFVGRLMYKYYRISKFSEQILSREDERFITIFCVIGGAGTLISFLLYRVVISSDPIKNYWGFKI